MIYKHLTICERSQIKAFLSINLSIKKIAKKLNRAESTIYREINRNKRLRGYREKQAHEKAVYRRHIASSTPRKLDDKIVKKIIQFIKLDWSPEQIAGRLRCNDLCISHETIYKMIWKDRREAGHLYKHLRRQSKAANCSRGNKQAGRGCILGRIDISKRPRIIEKKNRMGDFEADTVIGKGHKGVLVTLVDRKTKYTLIEAVPNKTSAVVTQAIIRALSRLPSKHVRTITFDNGKEFSGHEMIHKATGAHCYFATPYHSWERGLNEHTNGLIRQYFKKSDRLDHLLKEEVYKVERMLNNRPRKSLNFITPWEAIHGLRKPQSIALHA